jgi:hydroxymethylpyrimidine pyrophosphatase-like HAD family hydrolase
MTRAGEDESARSAAVVTRPDRLPYAVVATDLDGTLLDRDHGVSPRTARVLGDLTRCGVHLVFVTGRPIRWMQSVVDATGHRGLAVCSNGGVVLDLASMSVVQHTDIPAGVLAQLIDVIGREVAGITFGVESPLTYTVPDDYPHDPRDPGPFAVVGDRSELAAVQNPVKLIAKHARRTGDDLLAACAGAVEDAGLTGAAELTISGAAGLVEISAPGVSKAATLATLCAQWGLGAADVVAFGDMPNDVPLLRWAGRSYAMPNGHAQALAAATCTAQFTSDEDGVAVELTRLFDLG